MDRDVEAATRPPAAEEEEKRHEDARSAVASVGEEHQPTSDGAALAAEDSQSTHHSARPSLERYRSQNGYGVSDEPAEPAAPTYSQDKDPFEVGWDDGDNDPLCPRSFSRARKWLIVMICCGGSFTV